MILCAILWIVYKRDYKTVCILPLKDYLVFWTSQYSIHNFYIFGVCQLNQVDVELITWLVMVLFFHSFKLYALSLSSISVKPLYIWYIWNLYGTYLHWEIKVAEISIGKKLFEMAGKTVKCIHL